MLFRSAFVMLALAMGLGVGAVNGALVALLRVNSLVTTIGMNSLMLGITMHVTRGFSQQAPPPLNKFGVGKLLGVPLTLYVMIVIAAIAIFVLEKTTVGRRFIATSVNPDAALTVGIRLDWYRVATYAVAGFCYAAAGILLAGYVLSPTVFSGMPYLLASVAAVVVGGTSILGGRGSFLGTVGGAILLTTISTIIGALELPEGWRTVIYGVVILLALLLMREKILTALERRFGSGGAR